MMNLLSVDPGGTTGLAARINGSIITWTESTAEAVWDTVIGMRQWDAVICERFATAGRMSHYGLHTIELFGGVKALCRDRKIVFIPRRPADRVPFQLEAKQWLKMYPHDDGTKFVDHEEDALAHLLTYEHHLLVRALAQEKVG